MRMRVLVACDLRAGDATGASVAFAVSDATAAGAALGEGRLRRDGSTERWDRATPGVVWSVWGAPGTYFARCARENPAGMRNSPIYHA